MKRLSFLMALGILLCISPLAQAQQVTFGQLISEARSSNRTDARVLFQAWRALQRQNSRRVQRISLRERLVSRFDGPAGTWNSTVDMNVSGSASSKRWQNDFTGVWSDGRSVPRNEWSTHSLDWRSLLGDPFASLVEDPALPLHLFENMSPSGNAKEERINGAMHWRIEMIPDRGRAPYQRVTLWVHQEVGYLSRSRAVLSDRRSSIEVVTDYKRVNGIDVPYKRQFEGKVQSRRRSRVTTLFFNVQGEYSSYRFR